MAPISLVLPIRDFSGMTRLASVLSLEERSSLTVRLAERMLESGLGADLEPVVVSRSARVKGWADSHNVRVVEDDGTGLTSAAATGVDHCPGRWVLAHADLPYVTPDALVQVLKMSSGSTVLVPSVDGGTNVISSNGLFPFSFGEGSFHRHLASAPSAVVLPSRELSVELDTPTHLSALDFDSLWTKTIYGGR
ncbi:MAG: NTP transferase domain-containing protein [Acidimicrobiia bacterium]